MLYDEWKAKFFSNTSLDEKLILKAYQELNSKGTAVYAISADPPTWGHADIMMRAAKKFSNVHWVIATNSAKKYLFSHAEKVEMMNIYVNHYKLTNVKVDIIEGSVARFASKANAKFLLRGLRSSSDYQMEYELSVGNRGISKKLETICMFSKPHYATISSSIVRELSLLGEKVSQYVHPKVEELIKASIQKGRELEGKQ
jgi:pantetheine-phosphate adenylyltransferase